MAFRPLPWMTFFTVGSLVVLYILGQWQYDKFDRKFHRDSAPVVVLDSLEGEVLDAPIIQLYGIIDGDPVWRQVRPVETDEGEVVFVALGLYRGMSPASAGQQAGVPSGRVSLMGWKKPIADIGWFGRLIAPGNTPEKNIYHTFDTAIWRDALPEALQNQVMLDIIFEPERLSRLGDDSGGLLGGVLTYNPYALADPDPLPPERHLGYAWTWWGMALVLFVIYFAYHRAEGRLRFGGRA